MPCLPRLKTSLPVRALWMLVLSVLPLPAGAQAPAPILIWGISRGCQPMATINRELEKALYAASPGTVLLQTPTGQPLPPCVGADCAQLLRAACPGVTTGRMIGGQVATPQGRANTRLWLHDLATGQTAYADDYCESCGPGTAVEKHAQALLAKPRFDQASPTTTQPSYCGSDNVGTQSHGAVLLTVFGEGKGKAAVAVVQDAIQKQLTLRGHALIPSPEGQAGNIPELRRIVQAQPGAQLLGIHLQRDGVTAVFVSDPRSGQANQKNVTCPDCAPDKDRETLITRIKNEVASLLDYCYGASCGDPANRPVGTYPSVGACEPFEATTACAGTLTRASGAQQTATMDPAIRRVILGLTWGLTAASAATALTLGIVSPVITIERNGQRFHNTLTDPAIAVGATSAALLGITLPITLLTAQRPQTRPVPSEADSMPLPGIQCPR